MNTILNQFISRVQTATKSRSKDVRLTIEESQAIVAEITKLMIRDSSILDQINNILSASQTTRFSKSDSSFAPQAEKIILNGGRFTDEE